MTYNSPKFSEVCELNDTFIIHPYIFDRSSIGKNSPIIIISLPINMQIVFDNYQVSNKVFDYFNPLVVTTANLSKIKFYIDNTEVNTFHCLVLCSTVINSLLPYILKCTIYYSKDFMINYAESRIAFYTDKPSIRFYTLFGKIREE